jgi:hypothetical protein
MIRFIGGLWRILDANGVKSFTTYADAVAYLSNSRSGDPAWEDLGALYPSDDIQQQIHN